MLCGYLYQLRVRDTQVARPIDTCLHSMDERDIPSEFGLTTQALLTDENK